MKDPCDDRVENGGNKDGHPAEKEDDMHGHSDCDDTAVKDSRLDRMSASNQ